MSHVPAPIVAFIDATNAGDSEAFVAVFAADATLDDWGHVAQGHDGIREWDRTDNIGENAHLGLVDIVEDIEPDTYLVHLRVTGDGYNGTSPFRFTVRDGLIQKVVIVPD